MLKITDKLKTVFDRLTHGRCEVPDGQLAGWVKEAKEEIENPGASFDRVEADATTSCCGASWDEDMQMCADCRDHASPVYHDADGTELDEWAIDEANRFIRAAELLSPLTCTPVVNPEPGDRTGRVITLTRGDLSLKAVSELKAAFGSAGYTCSQINVGCEEDGNAGVELAVVLPGCLFRVNGY